MSRKIITREKLLVLSTVLFSVSLVGWLSFGSGAITETEAKETETAEYEEKTECETKTEPMTEAVTEETVVTEETEPVPKVEYFSVPLEQYMQDFIKAECKNKGIPPAVVVAIIERESRYNTYAMGDDGRSFGLMQIQPKWHLQRMINLKCTDLFQPYQNVTVGIDYLGELYRTYGDIEKALVAYNRGSYDGTITTYAIEVMARASELERGY